MTTATNVLKWTRVFAVAMPVCALLILVYSTWVSSSVQNRLPAKPLVMSTSTRNTQQRCQDCHSDITDNYHTAPHARTLTRADTPSNVSDFDNKTFHNNAANTDIHLKVTNGHLNITTQGYTRPVSATWIFGSGTHAKTPLITWLNEDGKTSGIEHIVSWYADGELGVTLGMDEHLDSEGIGCLGGPRTAAETINCFGCHSSYVPVENGRLVLDKLEPNIGCSRCHLNTRQHVENMDAGHASTMERFSELTPTESIDRCGECHRRAEELGGEILPEDTMITRFASVGLTQSKCFVNQAKVMVGPDTVARLDCTNCHNPHRPTSRNWQDHTAQCLKCHDAEHDRAVDCPTAKRNSNCLECHMPSVPANKHLSFTDHWIRVRPATK